MVLAMVVASLTATVAIPDAANGATLTQVRRQLTSWHLRPRPLFPAQLPAGLHEASVTLDRFAGVDFDVEFGKPANGCQRVHATDLCLELRRADSSTLGTILHDPDSFTAPRRVRLRGRNAWFVGEGRDAGGWVLAWHEQGLTYWVWQWDDVSARTAFWTLTGLARSLRQLSSR